MHWKGVTGSGKGRIGEVAELVRAESEPIMRSWSGAPCGVQVRHPRPGVREGGENCGQWIK